MSFENMSLSSQDNDGSIAPLKVDFIFKGKSSTMELNVSTSVSDIYNRARIAFDLPDNTILKLLYRGKVIGGGGTANKGSGGNKSCSCCSTVTHNEHLFLAFPDGVKTTTKPAKVLVMATRGETVTELNNKRSDPTIRGFTSLTETKQPSEARVWGPETVQNKDYKFCRFESCNWQSFGHRPQSSTPHAFRALQLLEKLATDPGVKAVIIERELVVGTLGEIDPVDDRLLQKKKEQGACLLGYNTGGGMRIDVKLRSDDLQDFLPYNELASTLIHELSHNWVGEHNELFWTNYGQMRVEYLWKHSVLSSQGYIVDGRTTADIAGCAGLIRGGMDSILKAVLAELVREMANHGLTVQSIAPLIEERCKELFAEHKKSERTGQILGNGSGGENNGVVSTDLRNLALAAAERRAKQNDNEKSA
eukprot:CAMPEP_0194375604 /NCGR_PEP_ID=MMETSP0174-20130528/24148_1 /TAXON_ID=216777 /ORGANISM="Proboscia alata, Strain PI-D3" /LENGTH=419 /DNA_ID=CAMNT_0039155923 /DNA_START=101 /DNA_END=1356 /DNA_ORIENTATION=+